MLSDLLRRWLSRHHDTGSSDPRLASVATTSTVIEICPERELTIPEGMSDRGRNPFVGWRSRPAELRRWRLQNVVLDRGSMVFLHKGRPIVETIYLQSPETVRDIFIDYKKINMVKNKISLVGFDHWDANYYHWIMHGVVPLYLNQIMNASKRAFPVVPRRSDQINESLHLLGIPAQSSLMAEPLEQYYFPAVDYYDYTHGCADFSISGKTQAAFDALAQNIQAGTISRVYIDRRGGGNRRMPEEDKLVSRLQERGFTCVRTETLSLERQIALFKGAKFVVALHGAGLTNIGFCQPGSFVYELVPSHYHNSCFVRLAVQANLHYWADAFDSGQENSSHTGEWAQSVDINAVIRRIDEIDSFILKKLYNIEVYFTNL